MGWLITCVLCIACGCRYGFAERSLGDATLDADDLPDDCWSYWRMGPLALTTPRRLDELDNGPFQGDPSLLADGLTIYFAAPASPNIPHTATRSARGAPWSAPVQITELDTGGNESRMSVTADGLLAIISSNRRGGSGSDDLWQATRTVPAGPFGPLSNSLLGKLNTAESEFDPELSPDGLRMYFAPATGTDQHLAFSTRPSISAPFEAPTLVAGLDTAGMQADPTISPDELVIAFVARAVPGPGDMYYATRTDRFATFGPPIIVPNVSSAGSEHDPELSPDGCELYFGSDRPSLGLYVADVIR